VKTATFTVTCDVAGCAAVGVADSGSMVTGRSKLFALGWRFGSTRDVCPACRAKGHRP
jgi:hypothetical protein